MTSLRNYTGFSQKMKLAQVHGVARGILTFFLAFVTPGGTMGSLKKFSQFGPAVWPAIANIYTS